MANQSQITASENINTQSSWWQGLISSIGQIPSIIANADLYQLRSADLPTGYAFLDLMPEGRYDTIVDTRIYRDVNLILDVNGVANSKVRVYPVEIIPSQL